MSKGLLSAIEMIMSNKISYLVIAQVSIDIADKHRIDPIRLKKMQKFTVEGDI
jgi:hypothetical protein